MEKTWQMRLKDQKWGVTFHCFTREMKHVSAVGCFFPSGFRVSVKLGVSVQDGHTKTLAISFRGWHPTDPTQLWKFYSAVIRIPKKNQPGFNVMSGKGFEACSKSCFFFSDHDMPTCKAHQAKLGNWGKEAGGSVFRGILKEPRFLGQSKRREFPQKESSIRSLFWLTFPTSRNFGIRWTLPNFLKKSVQMSKLTACAKRLIYFCQSWSAQRKPKSPSFLHDVGVEDFAWNHLGFRLWVVLVPSFGLCKKNPPKPEDVAEVSRAKVVVYNKKNAHKNCVGWTLSHDISANLTLQESLPGRNALQERVWTEKMWIPKDGIFLSPIAEGCLVFGGLV